MRSHRILRASWSTRKPTPTLSDEKIVEVWPRDWLANTRGVHVRSHDARGAPRRGLVHAHWNFDRVGDPELVELERGLSRRVLGRGSAVRKRWPRDSGYAALLTANPV